MYTLFVNLECKPGAEDAFRTAATDDATNSIQEPGCTRFDVYQEHDDPKRFVFIESYVDEEAFNAHKQTKHFTRWGQATKDIMAAASAVRCDDISLSDADHK